MRMGQHSTGHRRIDCSLVQPPVPILESMLTLRLRLDHCGRENGPVRVIDGSHRLGRLSSDAIDQMRRREQDRECLAAEGAILAFRPLLLHASAPATLPGHRRVLHFEYADQPLARPLAWYHEVA